MGSGLAVVLAVALGPAGPPLVTWRGPAPSGACLGERVVVTPSGVQYCCSGGTWAACGGGGTQGPQGIQGPAGTPGATGPQGPPGNNGADGAQGPQGTPGTPGSQGVQGIQGPPGSDGPAGQTGPAGTLFASDPAACTTGSYVTDQSQAGVLTCSVPPGTYSLPTAAAATLGGVKVGSGLAIDGAGVLSSTGSYTLPDATSSVTGGVRLTGDLGGTAASPAVPGLAGKASTAHSHGASEISGLDAGDTTTGTFAAALIPAATSSAKGGVVVPAADCNTAATSKLLYTASTGTLSCGTDQTGAGGGAGTMTRLTGTWASSASANALGIVGTGGVPMTSPAYGAAAPFSFRCQIATTRPATTNGPRYGVQTTGSVTRISWKAEVGLAATTETLTKGLALATASCATGCTTAITTGTVAQVVEDYVIGSGVMNAGGTLSLVMAPSAAAANTAQIGSYCIWY